MTVLTGVGAHFCAAHRDAGGRLHGHTYEVLAWFPAGGDAVDLRSVLVFALSGFDHAELLHEAVLAEHIAEEVGLAMPGCVQVDISRPSERLFARWIA